MQIPPLGRVIPFGLLVDVRNLQFIQQRVKIAVDLQQTILRATPQIKLGEPPPRRVIFAHRFKNIVLRALQLNRALQIKAEKQARKEMLKNESKKDKQKRILEEKKQRREAKLEHKRLAQQKKQQALADKRAKKEERAKSPLLFFVLGRIF